MRHIQKGLVYFSEEEFIKRVETPGFEKRSELVVAEDGQLERRIKPEVERGFKAFFQMADDLKNKFYDAKSESDILRLTWNNAGLNYSAGERSLALVKLYGHLVGVEQTERALPKQVSFSELISFYATEFAEPLLNEEAIRLLLKKVPLTRDEFNKLEDIYKSQGFVVARLTTARSIQRAQENLITTLKAGKSFADWRDSMDELFANLGMEPASSSYLETVYRTNVRQAYNRGRWEQTQQHIGIVSLFEYHAVLENNPQGRLSHRRMNGTKAPPDSSLWTGNPSWYPPNGYNCKCTVVAITKYMAKQYRLSSDIVIPNERPDEGFETLTSKGIIGSLPGYTDRANDFGIPLR